MNTESMLSVHMNRGAVVDETAERLGRSSQTLDWLTADHDGPCVSLQLPLENRTAVTDVDRLKLKNLCNDATARLQDMGVSSTRARQWLADARRLMEDRAAWRPSFEALGVYADEYDLKMIWMRAAVPERIMVCAHRFYVLPLLEDPGPGRVMVLCLSQNAVRLLELEPAPFGLQPCGTPVMHMREGFEVLGRYIDAEKQTHCHTSSGQRGPGGGGRDAVFHGHGTHGDKAAVKKWLVDYCRYVDQALGDAVSDDRTPVVLMAAEPLHAMFQRISRYPTLLAQEALGNPDHLSDHQVCQIARSVPMRGESRADRLVRQRDAAAGAGRLASGLRDILPHACDGRVESLMIRAGAMRWGHYDEGGRRVTVGSEDETGAEELINRAALAVWRCGGSVHRVAEARVLKASDLLAVLRY